MRRRNRCFRLFVYFTALVGLILYGHFFFPFVTLRMCLADPERYNGTTIVIGNEATVKQVFQDGFSIVQMNRVVRVFGPTDVKPNEFVVLRAVFHKDGWLEAKEIKVAKKRRAKIWLSVMPALFFSLYFLKRFRFNFRSLFFEEQNDA